MADERFIFYLEIPSFGVAVERLFDSTLRDAPVVLSRDLGEKSLVLEASVQAMELGISLGMPLPLAKKRAPELKVKTPRPDLYRNFHKKIEQKVILPLVPRWELVGLGRAFMDFTGLELIYKKKEDIGEKILTALKAELGELHSLPLGAASNKWVATLAAKEGSAEDKKKALTLVKEGQERAFISSFSVHYLPGGEKFQNKVSNPFMDLNLQTLGDVAALDPTQLFWAFGHEGERLGNLARGIDPNPVKPNNERSSIYSESYFEKGEQGPGVDSFLEKMLSRLLYQLRKKEKRAVAVKMAWRYIDLKYEQKELKLRLPCREEESIRPILQKMKKSWEARRVKLQFLALEIFLEEEAEGEQLSFVFSEKEKKSKRRVKTLDGIRERFGEGAVFWGREEEKGHQEKESTSMRTLKGSGRGSRLLIR